MDTIKIAVACQTNDVDSHSDLYFCKVECTEQQKNGKCITNKQYNDAVKKIIKERDNG